MTFMFVSCINLRKVIVSHRFTQICRFLFRAFKIMCKLKKYKCLKLNFNCHTQQLPCNTAADRLSGMTRCSRGLNATLPSVWGTWWNLCSSIHSLVLDLTVRCVHRWLIQSLWLPLQYNAHVYKPTNWNMVWCRIQWPTRHTHRLK